MWMNESEIYILMEAVESVAIKTLCLKSSQSQEYTKASVIGWYDVIAWRRLLNERVFPTDLIRERSDHILHEINEGEKLIEIIYKMRGKEKVSERVQAELLNSFTHSGANLSRHSILQCLITELFDCCWINLGIQWREIKLPIEAIWGFQIGLSADCFLSRSHFCQIALWLFSDQPINKIDKQIVRYNDDVLHRLGTLCMCDFSPDFTQNILSIREHK